MLGRMSALVSPAWLLERIADGGVVVVDATLPPVGVVPVMDVHARYLEGHVPGAVFFDIEALSDHGTLLPHMLPTPESFAESMAELGVGSADTIVVYEQEGVFSAPRGWWMLRTFGARNVRVLDGGLRAWSEAGLPVEQGPVTRALADFAAAYDAGAVRSFDEVERVIADGGQIADARSAGRFVGISPEPRAGIASGHMPGAVNVPFTELVEGGRMLDAERMREVFRARGVDLARPVVTTCGSGVTAAVLALGLAECGVTAVSLYDGSWAEWAQVPGAQIVSG